MPERETHINNLSADTKKSMFSRIMVAIVLVLIVLPLVIVGDYGFFAIVLVVAAIGAYEIIRTIKNKYEIGISTYVVTYISILSPFFLTLLLNNLVFKTPIYDLVHGFSSFQFLLLHISIILFSNFALSIFDKRIKLDEMFYLIGMDLLVSLGCISLLYLRYLPLLNLVNANNFDVYNGSIPLTDRFFTSLLLLIFVVGGAMLNDIFAYFTGVLFGKHKMCPRISPKKTWEGFFGGIILSTGVTCAIALTLTHFGFNLLPELTMNEWYKILIISLITPIWGTLGDLLFSLIKRHYEIKDFGTVLKSHGGVLDRMDSVLITAILGALIINLITIF